MAGATTGITPPTQGADMLRVSVSSISALISLLAFAASASAGEPASPFRIRGYYLTLMRMPTFDRSDWIEIVDRVRADGGNTLILWTAGGFRSKRFPETWEHNADHENVRRDFVRGLIDDAHAKGIKVLLGFTPFGYDGVNRMSLTRPEWKATGPDGKPTAKFGIHCWGYNLCPGREETQAFMLDYVREMYFEFYLNADGLLIESSDYAVCHCERCGPRFFDNEFRFVRTISDEVWARKPEATIVVYPHYFTGTKTPVAGATAAKQPFDSRWTVFFTPHSAPPDAALIAAAKDSIWSDDGPALRTPAQIRDGARRARSIGCTGYVPSIESFSYVVSEPEEGQTYLIGRRQVPFGFGWLAEGQIPYDELPIRINRIAYREFTRDPDLTMDRFEASLGEELFGADSDAKAVEDALFLHKVFQADRTWSQAAPLADPARVAAMRGAGTLTDEQRERLVADLHRVRRIAARYKNRDEAFTAMTRPAEWLSDRWSNEERLLADP
ncbi:MAG: hypothetical protein WBC44_05805 [Planctomycetaceae bacterium]